MVTRDQAMRQTDAALQTAGDTVTVNRDTLETLRSLVSGPSQDTANQLWKWLVPGLLLLTLISLVGLLYLIADGKTETSPDLALTTFTATLTGLLGLFIRAPQ
jgi:hypothetical protein